MRISHWPPAMVEQRWQDLSPFFVRALEYVHDEMTMADLFPMLLAGMYHVAVVDDAGEIVAVVAYRAVNKPRLRVLICELCSGDRLYDWIDLNYHYGVDLKDKMGCDRLELVGRLGWARVLRRKYPNRFREKSVTLILENDDGRIP